MLKVNMRIPNLESWTNANSEDRRAISAVAAHTNQHPPPTTACCTVLGEGGWNIADPILINPSLFTGSVPGFSGVSSLPGPEPKR